MSQKAMDDAIDRIRRIIEESYPQSVETDDLYSALSTFMLNVPEPKPFLIQDASGSAKSALLRLLAGTEREAWLESVWPHYTHWLTARKHTPSEGVSQTDYDRLRARHAMLLSLLGSSSIAQRLSSLFTGDMKSAKWRLSFVESRPATLGDYASYFTCIDRIYKLLLTFADPDCFSTRWLHGEYPEFPADKLMLVSQIRKASPGSAEGTAVAEVIRQAGNVLSVGKQVEDFRMAGVRVQDARLELEKKRREFEKAKEKDAESESLKGLEREIERAKKQLELERLRTQTDEEVRKRRTLMFEDVEQRFEVLARGMKILSEVPQEIQKDFKAALLNELEDLNSLPLQTRELRLLPEDATAEDPASADPEAQPGHATDG